MWLTVGWLPAVVKVYVGEDRRQRLVVLHSHHHLVVHGQPRGVPHHRANAHADRVRRRSVQADGNSLRHAERRIHQGFLPGTRQSWTVVRWSGRIGSGHKSPVLAPGRSCALIHLLISTLYKLFVYLTLFLACLLLYLFASWFINSFQNRLVLFLGRMS